MALARLAGEHPLVLGLPRGGLPVAHEVALALGADLDLLDLDFSQTSDGDVVTVLRQAHTAYDASVRIPIEPPSVLPGHCTIPRGAVGVVVFAHGSGSSRHSPRNQAVARYLNEHGLGTLLLDLLTEGESADPRKVFDIELLAQRLLRARAWLVAAAFAAPGRRLLRCQYRRRRRPGRGRT